MSDATSESVFRRLHRPGKPFVLANAWDIGSAKVLEALGAEAIATSSAAHAFTLGRPDMGRVSRSEALDHAHQMVQAVSVPVSGDLENGYGHSPSAVAETVRMAAEAGLDGCSIEDTSLPDPTPYSQDQAVARIEAAVEAARSAEHDFVLVARADGVMNGRYNMAEAIARVERYEAAGADCVYVPLPPTMEDLAAVCSATTLPVNALAAGPFAQTTVEDFARIGVARISIGSALARVTHQALIDAARRFLGAAGDFSLLGQAASGVEIDQMLETQTG